MFSFRLFPAQYENNRVTFWKTASLLFSGTVQFTKISQHIITRRHLMCQYVGYHSLCVCVSARAHAVETALTAVRAEPAWCDVQGQGVSQRPPGPQIEHPVRVMPSAPTVLIAGTVGSGGRAPWPATGTIRVRPSWGVKVEGHGGTVLDAHASHGAHRAATKAHGAARPVVAEVGRGWHRAVIRRNTGKSTPGPTRCALLSPHPKRVARVWGLWVETGGGSARFAEKGCRPPPLVPVCLFPVRPCVSAGSSALTLCRRNSPFPSWAEHEPALMSGFTSLPDKISTVPRGWGWLPSYMTPKVQNDRYVYAVLSRSVPGD